MLSFTSLTFKYITFYSPNKESVTCTVPELSFTSLFVSNYANYAIPRRTGTNNLHHACTSVYLILRQFEKFDTVDQATNVASLCLHDSFSFTPVMLEEFP